MSDTLKKNTLRVATLSATYNIILQISLRVVTFISNAIILRSISRDVLGVINVRLLLLYTTIQFLSREPFRRVSISASKTHEWPQIVNLISLTMPLSLIFGSFLSLIWYYFLERPDPQYVADYGFGVISIFVSVLIELISEPLYIWAQIQSFIKFKVIADGMLLMTRTLIMVAMVAIYPEKAILVFSLAQITSSVVYSSIYFIFFIIRSGRPLNHFIPKFIDKKSFIDGSLLVITFSFLKNTTLKQFLTEGERFVMTFFSVISFAEQGVYDVINNIGSLPARLVFQQIEESGYLLFTQKIDRQKSSSDQNPKDLSDSSVYLKNLIKLMSLLGLVLFVFGYNYSDLALLIYGGQKLSENLGTILLQWHCIYIVFIAINGITECFTFAAMNSQQIDSFNKKMVNISVIFLISSYGLTKWFGCIGFIMANCLNMFARIIISLKFIHSYYGSTKVDIPLKGAIPCLSVNISFLMIFSILFSLKLFMNFNSSLARILIYILIGFICLLINLSVIYLKERELITFIQNLFKSSDKFKTS